MDKKLTNLIKTFFGFLIVNFFYLPISKAFADTPLEIQYPTDFKTITGQTVSAVTDLPSYMKYMFSAGMTIGFSIVIISLTIGGILYFLAPISADAKKEAKDRIAGAISGLLILVLTYLIITTINPQLNIFSSTKLQETPLPTVQVQKDPGVYFYKESGCPENGETARKSNIVDLADLKKKLKSINIVQDTTGNHSYISILYENPNLWGSCQYVDPNKGCQTVDPFASSASIHEYDSSSSANGGVYFFHKSCVSTDISNSNDIDKLIEQCKKDGYYMASKGVYQLKDLKFQQVPDEEKECEKYDKNSTCTSKKDPTLAGDNISSVIIKGNYMVLFFYFGPNNESQGKWASCQEFPNIYDVNNAGPRQMKWEIVRNTKGLFPNYISIIPIKGPTPTAPASSLIPIIP